MSGKVWRVEIVFKKTVSTYVEADSIPEARRIITAAAADMDVMDSPGSDFDGWDVQEDAGAGKKPSEWGRRRGDGEYRFAGKKTLWAWRKACSAGEAE